MSIVSRFFECLELSGIKPYDIEVKLGVKSAQSKISQLKDIKTKSGKDKALPVDILAALCMADQRINPMYIMNGTGTPLSNGKVDADFVEESPCVNAGLSNVEAVGAYISDNLVRVPYVPVSATASFIDSLYDVNYEMDTYSLVPEKDELLDEKYMVFQVNGDSMEPTIPDGSKILAHKIDESQWENADGVVVVVYGKVLTVKRIKKNALYLDNLLVLKADNHKHGEMDVERREIRGMWKVKRIVSLNIV